MSEWIEWQGGEYDADPVGRINVEVRFRNGVRATMPSCAAYWRHDGDDIDIIAYRIIKDTQ